MATDTVQVGQHTLDALYHQGQQLDRAAHGVEQVGSVWVWDGYPAGQNGGALV